MPARIVLGVGAGIAAYKVPEAVEFIAALPDGYAADDGAGLRLAEPFRERLHDLALHRRVLRHERAEAAHPEHEQPAGLGGPYGQTQVPRVEAEGTYKTGDVLVWANGTVQNAKDPTAGGSSKTATGAGGGFRFGRAQFSLTGSGYWGKGIGTTLQFNGTGGPGVAVGADGELRTSYGFIGQVTVTPANSKVTLAGSYGSSWLKSTSGEPAQFKTENSLISGGVYFQATKSLKVVGEGDYAWTKEKVAATPKNKTFAGTFGLMLFF